MEKKETELPGDIIVSMEQDAKIEAYLQQQKGVFVTEILNRKRAELGNIKFEEERTKLSKQAAECWDLAQEGKRQFDELEEVSHRKIMEWKELEKPLRQWLLNEAEGEGWTKDGIEKSVEHRLRDFAHAQSVVRQRAIPIIDPIEDFSRRVLNPETRKEAINQYLVNRVDANYFVAEAFNLIFEKFDKRNEK